MRVIEMTATRAGKRVCRDSSAFLTLSSKLFFDIEINNFAARCHDIAHDAAAQIERVDEHVASER